MSFLPSRRRKNPANTFKSLKETETKRSRLKILLPLIAALLAAYPVGYMAYSVSSRVAVLKPDRVQKPRLSTSLNVYQAFRVASSVMGSAKYDNGRPSASLSGGGSVSLTIDPELQERVVRVMEQYRVPYGTFVAVEPKTGRVLALAGHSTVNPAWGETSFFNLYPMASLFKIVTAAAALEQKKVLPDTVFAFRGRLYSENPKYWSVRNGGGNQQMPLSLAMGKSINPVFGRLASDVVGKDSIMSYADKFGFNQTLFPEVPVTPSKAQAPRDDLELKLMGAGLGREVKISPLHAAFMIAAIANGGTMMTPLLADEIKSGDGTPLFVQKPAVARRLVSAETARQLATMLSTTVNTGTSRKAFHDRHGRPKLASINICAKTGSINGKDPEGSYSWFAAYAPAEDPKIALVALVINQDKWKIKGSFLGEQALEAFFK